MSGIWSGSAGDAVFVGKRQEKLFRAEPFRATVLSIKSV